MDKKMNRKIPWKIEGVPETLDKFIEFANLDSKIIMRRLNKLMWDDINAIIVPMELKDHRAGDVKSALNLIEYGWKAEEIMQRLDLTKEQYNIIIQMNPEEKGMYKNMKSKFFLKEDDVNFNQIFGGK